MSILMSSEIKDAIYRELDSATDSVQVISAFCKENTLQALDSHIAYTISKKRLLVRFRLDDLINGSTDFRVLDYGREHGWKTYIRFDLHAKTYIVDDKRGIIGSANATRQGLTKSNGNLEIATVTEISHRDLQKIDNLFFEAILVNDDIYQKLKRQYESVEDIHEGKHYIWNKEITDMFVPEITAIFSYDFPDSADITPESVLSFLGLPLNASKEQIKEAFSWCRGYRWVVQTAKENGYCIYFGELSRKLHDAIIEDPKPYRRDIKVLLSNMLSWIKNMNLCEIIVDRPGHSQRISYIREN